MKKMQTLIAMLLAGMLSIGALAQAADKKADGGVLVFGGSGRLGSEIIKLLVDADNSVTVFTRAGSDHSLLKGMKVSYVEGDMLNKDDVAAAFRSARFRVVIDASWGRDAGFFEKSMRNVSTYAKETGVKQLILHNSVGAGGMERFPYAGFSEVKTETGKVMDRRPVVLDITKAENVLVSSGVPYTVIRHAVIWDENTPATGYAWLSEDHNVFTGITRKDLATLTMSCLDNPKCINKIYNAADNTLSWHRGLRP